MLDVEKHPPTRLVELFCICYTDTVMKGLLLPEQKPSNHMLLEKSHAVW